MGPDSSDAKAMREVQRKSYFNGAACLAGALLVHCAVTWSLSPPLVSGGAALLAVLLVGVLARVPPSTRVLQAFSSLALLWLALFGTRVYQRMIAAQREAHQSRLQALEQLAESERLRGRAERERAEVERLVLMGQLAAGVAHEVNNPLAFVKANLSFLRDETKDGLPRLEPWELRELVEETPRGVVRIQQIVTDLRGFSRSGQLGEAEEAMPSSRPSPQAGARGWGSPFAVSTCRGPGARSTRKTAPKGAPAS